MNLIDNTSFLWIASGYKSGSLFSIVPNTSAGDLTTFRSTSGSRINSGGFVELVGPGVGRLDYTTTASCPFVRLESDRTNYIYSSDLLQGGTTAWTSSSLRSFVTSSITAPNSSSNVCLVTESLTVPNNDSSDSSRYVQQLTNLTAGSTITYSVFAKRYSTGSLARNIGLWTQNANGAGVFYILEGTGSWYAELASTPKTNTTYVSGAMIEPVGDGWYRCSATIYNGTFGGFTSRARFVIVSGSSFDASSRVTTGAVVNYTGNANAGLYLWGAQAESGSAHGLRSLPSTVSNSLASAYISSSVAAQGSRTTDRLITFPSTTAPTNFTVYVVLKTTAEDSSGGQNFALASSSLSYYAGWYKGTVPIYNSGSGDTTTIFGGTTSSPASLTAGDEHKLAIRYSASYATWFRNGALVGSASFPIPSSSWTGSIGGLGIGTTSNTCAYTQYFRTVAVIDRGLTDAEVIQLTT